MFRNSVLFQSLFRKSPYLNSYTTNGDTLTLNDPSDFSSKVWNIYQEIQTKNIRKVIVTTETGGYSTDSIPWQLVEEVEIQRKADSKFGIDFKGSKILKKVSLGIGVKSITGNAFSKTSISEIDLSYVTSNDGAAFQYCPNLQKLVLPKVQTIPDYFARRCSNLVSVDISSATSIKSNAFYNCISLSEIKFASNINSIGAYAFSLTAITSLTVPTSLSRISLCAFAYSSLATVTFPSSTTVTLEARVFEGTRIETIEFPANIKFDLSNGDGIINGTITLTKITFNPTSIPKSFARNCVALESLIAPNANIVNDYAFYNCKKLATLTLAKSVTQIGKSAFAYCESLVYDIPQNDLKIGDNAFMYCSNLKTSTIPANWKLGQYVFVGCSGIPSLDIKADLTNCQGLFQGCTGITSLTIASSNVPIYCFANCTALKTVTFLKNVFLDVGSFASTGPIENLDLTKATSYSIAFKNSQIKSVTIRGDTYGELAFSGCWNLETITLSKDSTWFDGTIAVNVSSSLKIVPHKENTAFTVKDDMVQYGSGLFALLPSYKKSTFTAPAGILYFGKGFLSMTPAVTEVIIDNNGLRIAPYCFAYAYTLEKVTIKSAINKFLPSGAFRGCYALEEVSFPDQISQIGDR